MQPTDRKRANLIIGAVVGLLLILGLGWMALQTSRAIPSGEVAQGPPVFEAEWLKLPTPEDVLRVYPPRAKADRISDRALVEMRCVVSETGGLEGCAIFNESVAGYGFAKAALDLSDRFELKTESRDGTSLVGLPVTVPLAFDAMFANEEEEK